MRTAEIDVNVGVSVANLLHVLRAGDEDVLYLVGAVRANSKANRRARPGQTAARRSRYLGEFRGYPGR